jgi:addiction module HigA family antidote
MAARKLAPVHPGEMLLEEFMKPLGLIPSEVARRLDVPPNRISQLIQGKRALTADTALRLERYLGWPARMWMQIQAEYDLELSRRAAKHPRIRPHPRIRAAGKPATLAKTASA